MTMEQKLIDLFIENWNECDTDEKISVHNSYVCENNCGDDEIFSNDEDFFDNFFDKPADAVRAAYYGKYRYGDDYVWFNGYGNLESSSYESDLPFADEKEMAEWFIENYSDIDHIDAMDEFCDACKYGFDEDEEDDD